MTISIGDREIGLSNQPFIIAEMSGNHNQDIKRALAIVKAASESGASAIKLQTYTADTITLDSDNDEFVINDPSSLWKGQKLYDLYDSAHTPWDWHQQIFDYARELGLICFSSPFDESAVDFLEGLDAPAYKIASFENNHLPLIAKVAKTGKPVIISTGMATLSELDEAVSTARDNGCEQLILLKCTSTYPASPENTNLRTIRHMRDLFNCEIGLSDHTLGIGVSLGALSLGATVIEKHFTMSRADGGVDSAFSLEPAELTALVEESKRAWEALGEVKYGPTTAEIPSRALRRSIYVSADIAEGEFFTEKNLRIVRPGNGAPPSIFWSLLGKRANKSYTRGMPLTSTDMF